MGNMQNTNLGQATDKREEDRGGLKFAAKSDSSHFTVQIKMNIAGLLNYQMVWVLFLYFLKDCV